ncbi:unnamed protein product [Clonostachys chloroleuca]|uniref:Myb-like domain-containing protein n=1 Tax=Clonostachys chloroleuca TaxID=1926264 RepID=A0AA35MHP7_9HYPO|nr:unnamed protein product [Clonostachys chloroleuca]
MPPKKATSGDGDAPQGLNSNEMKFIKAVFDNMTQKPDANWDNVAVDLGLKDAKCAKERFRQLSVRHGWRDQAGAGTGARKAKPAATVTKKPRTPRKKKAMKEESDEDDDNKNDVKSEEDSDKSARASMDGSI